MVKKVKKKVVKKGKMYYNESYKREERMKERDIIIQEKQLNLTHYVL